MDIPSKVAHTRYAVAETRIFWYKADNCNICTKVVKQCSFVLSSRNRAHVDQMSGTDVARRLHPI